MDKFFSSFILIDICIDNVKNIKCIFGSSLIIISIFLLILLIYGFIKMTIFYKHLNFENFMILGCILQCIIMIFVLFTYLNFILEIFYCFQILMISYVVQRMILIIKDIEDIIQLSNNLFFILINIFNAFIFILFQISFHLHFSHTKKRFFENIYRIYSIIINLFLLYYGIKLIKLIDNNESNKNKNIKKKSIKHNSILSITIIPNCDEIKKSQIHMLITFNVIFSILQFSFNLIKNFILINEFSTDNKDMITNPISNIAIYLFYFYLLICILNIFINFITFFWCIREQYDLIFNEGESNSLYATIKNEERETVMYKGRESSKKFKINDLSIDDIQKYNNEGGKDLNEFLKKSMRLKKNNNIVDSFQSYFSKKYSDDSFNKNKFNEDYEKGSFDEKTEKLLKNE